MSAGAARMRLRRERARDRLANSFLESLRSFGAFDAMLPSMRRGPFAPASILAYAMVDAQYDVFPSPVSRQE